MPDSTYLYQLVSLSPSSQSVHLSSLLTLNIPILFGVMPQHQSVPSTALDIQHFLKPFTITFGEICCHAVMIHPD